MRAAPVGPPSLHTRSPEALLVDPGRVKSGSDMGLPSSHVTANSSHTVYIPAPCLLKNELELRTWELIGVMHAYK